METALDYDFYEGAIEIPHTDGWTSVNAAYSTIGATPDQIPGSLLEYFTKLQPLV